MKATIFSIGISVATGSLLLLAATPSQAFTFGNEGISFDETITGKFNFLGSQGRAQSDFGVFNVTDNVFTSLISELAPGYDSSANDWAGTCGDTVTTCSTTFKFEAGKQYSFLLKSIDAETGTDRGTVSTTTSQNAGGVKLAKFDGLDPFAGKVDIWFEDRGGFGIEPGDLYGDQDFNDFGVSFTAVPEPATLLGLGLVAGVAILSRKEKAKKAV